MVQYFWCTPAVLHQHTCTGYRSRVCGKLTRNECFVSSFFSLLINLKKTLKASQNK